MRRVFPVLLGAGVVVAGLSSPAAAINRPDLVEVSVSKPPATIEEGKRFAVTERVKNEGTAAAAASTTRYYLSLNRARNLADIRLLGRRSIPRLGVDGASRGTVSVRVPLSVPPARYYLLACADDLLAARESNEGNNCRASSTRVEVVPSSDSTAAVRAFADSGVVLPQQLSQMMDQLKAFLCARWDVYEKLGLRAALANAWAFLEREAGEAAIEQFLASPHAANADEAEQAAAAAGMARVPAGALVALLHAHRKDAKDPDPLANAAPLLVGFGMPNEALAFLTAADARQGDGSAAFGMNKQAVLLANRSFALLRVGRHVDAETAARAALAIDPLVTEAAMSLSLARLCRNDKAGAMAFARIGSRRDPPPSIIEDPETGQERPPAAEVLDLSQGVEGHLPPLQIPFSPDEAVELKDYYDAIDEGGAARQEADLDRRNELVEQRNARPPRSPATQRRTFDIFIAIYTARHEPAFRNLYEVYQDGVQPLITLWSEYWGANGEVEAKAEEFVTTDPENFPENFRQWCIPTTQSRHAQWKQLAHALDTAVRNYVDAVYPHQTGLAANLGDPVEHEIASIDIRREHDAHFYAAGLVGPIHSWVTSVYAWRDYCSNTPSPVPAQPEEPDTPPSQPCPEGLKAFSFVLELLFTEVKANCEELTVEASSEGWLQAFAEVSLNPATGDVTIVAGAKAEAEIGPFGADFKSGIYVKGTSDGSAKDVGWRVGPSTEVGAGPVEYQGPSDTMDFSFVGGVSYLFGG